MAERPAKPLFPNPFYVVLLAASTLFVLTTLAYLVSPLVQAPGETAGRPGATVAERFDRFAPTALGVEFVVMLAAGGLAMATDRWFSPESARKGSRSGT